MKSMKDCKTQEEKDELVNNQFYKIGIKIQQGYHYKNYSEKIPFTVIDKDSLFYGFKGHIRWCNVVKGQSWKFQSLIQEDKDTYIKNEFLNIGAKIDDNYHYKTNHIKIPFTVINKNSELYGYKCSASWAKVQSFGFSFDSRTLLRSEYKRYVDNICKKLSYSVIKYPKNIDDKFTIKTKDNNIWNTTLWHIMEGKRCPLDTTASFGERCLVEIFKLNNIEYEYQNVIYHNDTSWQMMDFYLPDYNMCIEYNGIQHYEETQRSSLIYSYTQDLKKYQYCKKNNIKYCEIPYIYDSIESITQYVEDKILFRPLLSPNYTKVQYSKLYKDQDIINAYNKYKSGYVVGKLFKISNSTVLYILDRHKIKKYSNKKPIVQISMTNKIIKIYEHASLPEKMGLLFRQANICAVARNERKIAYGFKWMFLSDYKNKHPELTDKKIIKLMVMDKNI